MNMRERIARAIAQGLGDDYDKAFVGKSEWTAARGEVAGSFRDINQPYRTDYDDAADAVLAAMAEPTEAMAIAGGKAHCEQVGCASDFESCCHCHGKAVTFNGSLKHGDGCVNGSVAAYRAMLAAAGEPE